VNCKGIFGHGCDSISHGWQAALFERPGVRRATRCGPAARS
jgi:hypothetical protein